MRRTTLIFLALAVLACLPAGASARDYSGRLDIEHADNFKRGRSVTRYWLERRGRRIPLRPSSAPRIRAGERVIVRGRFAGRTLRGKVRPARRGVRAATVLPGPRKVAVILFNFTDDTSEPFTPAAARDAVFTGAESSNAFYKEQTYNQVELVGRDQTDGDVYGWVHITASRASCDYAGWASLANAAVGTSLVGYDHYVYVFPHQSSCGWAGLGYMPGDTSWSNGDLSVRVIAHELGHNMGLHHASSYKCTDAGGPPAAIGPNCTQDEYGDPFDYMGIGYPDVRRGSAWHLRQLGTIPSTNMRTISASGSYTVTSTVAQTASKQLLRVARPGHSGEYYYLDLRTPGGVFDDFAPSDFGVNGVGIRIAPDPSSVETSRLIDTTPTASSSFGDAPLAVGQTFTDAGLSITTSSISGTTATVQVTMPTGDTTPPVAPASVVTSPDSGGVSLSWSPATDNVGVTQYRVSRNGSQIATTTATSYRDSGVAPGFYTYRVSAYDAAGNSATSAPAYATVPELADPDAGAGADAVGGTDADTDLDGPIVAPDVTAPVLALTTPVRGARVRGTLRVRAVATDESGVARMVLALDGKRVKTASGSRLNASISLKRVRPGRHTLKVQAVDLSGNTATRTVPVKVLAARRR